MIAAKSGRDFLVSAEIQAKQDLMDELRQVFLDMDEDHTGDLTYEEMEVFVLEPKVVAHLATIGLQITDMDTWLFSECTSHFVAFVASTDHGCPTSRTRWGACRHRLPCYTADSVYSVT